MNKYALSLLLLPIILSVATASFARTFKQALPGYTFSFPRDHASHGDYKTEWWYYTGHLQSKSGKKYGYELTFFRQGMEEGQQKPRNAYLAHFAISDQNTNQFHVFERLSRSGLPTGEARSDLFYVANQGWSAESLGDQFLLRAESEGYAIHLLLSPAKPPVVHGKNGVSQKASGKGCASHYYSMTRLKTKGTLFIDSQAEPVEGISWMDHEFGSNQLTDEQVGWDWFSIQLDDNSEIMLYIMRRRDGTIDNNSSGTLINSDGSSIHLNYSDFTISSKSTWISPHSQGKYPMGWQVKIPKCKIDLSIEPAFKDQELITTRSTDVTYWEGSSQVSGSKNGNPTRGQSYVEMTGYAAAFKKKI